MGRFTQLEFDRHEDFSDLAPTNVPKDEKYYVGLAELRMREGKFENGLRFYSRALEFNAQLAGAWLGQVQALIELEEPAEARLWADKGLDQFRNHAELLAAKGVASTRLGDLDQGMALSDAAMAERGGSAYRWRARGDVLLGRRERNADFCFGKAMAAAGNDWYEPLAVGRIYLYYRQPAPALRYLEQAVERQNQSSFAWQSLGEAREASGMIESAQRAFRQAAQLDPLNRAAHAGATRMENAGGLASLLSRVRGWFRGGKG